MAEYGLRGTILKGAPVGFDVPLDLSAIGLHAAAERLFEMYSEATSQIRVAPGQEALAKRCIETLQAQIPILKVLCQAPIVVDTSLEEESWIVEGKKL